jgi:MFS family permease
MVLAVIILLATTREKKLAEMAAAVPGEESREAPQGKSEPLSKPVKKSLILILVSIFLWFMGYNAITTAFSKYATTVWGMAGGSFALTKLVGTIFAVLTYIPAGIVAIKIGRKKTILGGLVLLVAAYFMAYFYTSYHWSVNIVLALTGIGWAAINVNSYPMVVEMARGSDIGKYTGYYYTFSMSAQILTPILSGAMFEVVASIARNSLVNYTGDIALRASQIGYSVLFPYALLFSIAAFITMRLVRHGDSRPEAPADKLEMMDIGD